jgi:hypothetical protein
MRIMTDEVFEAVAPHLPAEEPVGPKGGRSRLVYPMP